MKRFEVWLARLDPAEGSEMRKTRPVVIVSPDEMNARLHTVLVAPLTAGGFIAPFRVPCRFAGGQRRGRFGPSARLVEGALRAMSRQSG